MSPRDGALSTRLVSQRLAQVASSHGRVQAWGCLGHCFWCQVAKCPTRDKGTCGRGRNAEHLRGATDVEGLAVLYGDWLWVGAENHLGKSKSSRQVAALDVGGPRVLGWVPRGPFLCPS